jgi:hypothetical protein
VELPEFIVATRNTPTFPLLCHVRHFKLVKSKSAETSIRDASPSDHDLKRRARDECIEVEATKALCILDVKTFACIKISDVETVLGSKRGINIVVVRDFVWWYRLSGNGVTGDLRGGGGVFVCRLYHLTK